MTGATSIGWLAVAAGGAAGACLRHALSSWLASSSVAVPLGTLVANSTGCLLAGAWLGYGAARGAEPATLHLLLMTGFLGAFTTFSAFSAETLALVRDGQFGFALANIALNVGVSLAAVTIGFWCSAGRIV